MPPGVDPRFAPGGEKSATPLVVTAGRLVPVKRFEELIEVLIRVKAQQPGLEAVIVGEGYRRDDLEAQLRETGADRWIRLAGHVSDEELLGLYRRAWVVASAAAREGWGMTITEAGASGTPAVATRIAGHTDAIVHEHSGLLVDRREDFVLALDRVLRDTELRERLSRGAIEHASLFTWAATARGTLEVLEREQPTDTPEPVAVAERPSRRTLGYFLLALVAYVPPLLTAPGKVAADTKQYLYLDPTRLLERAPSMWDPNIGLGTVTHQNIGYLFPMGPYYWVMENVGFPSWIAQRIWLGSIVFFAGLGVLYLLRTIDMRGPGAVVAALAYMLSPYSLHYAARISVILLPWAGLGWMLALMVRALRKGGWRYPAAFAIVVQIVGSVNATALVFALLAPLLSTGGERRRHWLASACSPSVRRCGGSPACGPRAATASTSSSTPRRSRPWPPRASRPRCCAGSATGSSTGATSSATGSKPASTTRRADRSSWSVMRSPPWRCSRPPSSGGGTASTSRSSW